MKKFSNEWVDALLGPKKKKLGWLMTNSGGKKSASLTLLILASAIVFLRLLLGGVILEVGEFKLGLQEANITGLSMFILPFITLYFGRRWVETKETPEEPE